MLSRAVRPAKTIAFVVLDDICFAPIMHTTSVVNSETHERSPLLESAQANSVNSRISWNSCKQYAQHQKDSWNSGVEFILYAWPLVWLDNSHRYRLAFCAGISLLQLIFYARVPYLFGNAVEGVLEPNMWIILTELLTCIFIRDYLCTRLRPWIWQPYALRSQQLTAEIIQDRIFSSPRQHAIWSSGGFLSEYAYSLFQYQIPKSQRNGNMG